MLSRCVLGLVQDDEGVVQGTSAHVRQGGDFDRAGRDEARNRLRIDHVVQRVIQGAQVGIDLFAQSSGKEAQALPRLDSGTGQHDAVHLLGLQRLHRLGHRQVGLAGTSRANPEHHGVLVDRIDVPLLIKGLGSLWFI